MGTSHIIGYPVLTMKDFVFCIKQKQCYTWITKRLQEDSHCTYTREQEMIYLAAFHLSLLRNALYPLLFKLYPFLLFFSFPSLRPLFADKSEYDLTLRFARCWNTCLSAFCDSKSYSKIFVDDFDYYLNYSIWIDTEYVT